MTENNDCHSEMSGIPARRCALADSKLMSTLNSLYGETTSLGSGFDVRQPMCDNPGH